MTMYDVMYEAIVERYQNGELTIEQANELNELAYDRYYVEGFNPIKAASKAISNVKDKYEDKKSIQKRNNIKVDSTENYLRINGKTSEPMSTTDARLAYKDALKKGCDVEMYTVDKNTGKWTKTTPKLKK